MATLITYSEVMICKMALSRIGAASTIETLDTSIDTSTEAAACALWYPQDRDATITDWEWPWARTSAVLNQVNTLYPATPEYQYSYRYPSDCLDLKRVVPTVTPAAATSPPQTTGLGAPTVSGYDQWWLRPEGDAYPWGFRIQSDDTGRLVCTDLAEATALYIRRVTDPTQFAPDFVSMLAWRLAVSLAMELAVSEKRMEIATKGYRAECMRTRGRIGNESQSDIPVRNPNSEFVRRRFF